MNDRLLNVELKCIDLPGLEFDGRTGIRLGIQKGREVINDVPGNAGSVTFNFQLRVEKSKTGHPNFLGPYAQGTPADRFVYLCWGERIHGSWNGFRRAKIKLSHLDWNTVEKALSIERPIEATISMTDRLGNPLCATVREDQIEWLVNGKRI